MPRKPKITLQIKKLQSEMELHNKQLARAVDYARCTTTFHASF